MTRFRFCLSLILILGSVALSSGRVWALDAIIVTSASERIPIMSAVEISKRANGAMLVRFALVNEDKAPLNRVISTPGQTILGSGFLWPDLSGANLTALKADQSSANIKRLRQRGDAFQITLMPDQTVVLTATFEGRIPAEIYVWALEAHGAERNQAFFFQGLLLGITGLIAIFLSSLYIIRRRAMFPAAALVSWAAFVYLGSEFGLISGVFGLGIHAGQAVHAISEVMLAAGLVILYANYLQLSQRLNWVKYAIMAGAGLLPLMLVLAIFLPHVAAGLVRMAMPLIAIGGMSYVIMLALKGANRAQTLLPSWGWLLIWTFLTVLSQSGLVNPSFSAPLTSAGLVLLVILLTFTVIQYAFGSGLPAAEGVSGRAELNALAFVTTGLGVWDWNIMNKRIRTGPEIERQLELRPGTLDSDEDSWGEHIHSSDRTRFETLLQSAAETPDSRLDCEFRLRRNDGIFRWYRLTARPVMHDQGMITRMVGALQDISTSKNAEERLLHDAVHDSLTGLPNRALFLDRLERAIERARAGLTSQPVVAVVDFDRFRNINDAFGHAAGDNLLLVMARRLERCIEIQDTLTRLSGDDFAIIMTSPEDEEQMGEVASQIAKTVAAPVMLNNREVFLTASIGLAVYNGKQNDPSDLLKEAEMAMTRAKSLGPDKIELFKPSMRSERQERIMLETDLRGALDRHEIDILYQPVVALATEHLAGFEALVRWHHPEHGELAPRAFLNIAEETGLIIDLGRFVLDTAARQLGTWQRAFSQNEPIFISVNVSSKQLFNHDLIEDVKAALGRSHVVPGTLKLEITESLVMENPEYAVQVLKRVRDLGAGLSLDDFGTGYSALSYLQKYPFDTLKVDKSFLSDIPSGGNTPVILKAIVSLAHELGMEVVAEGAETAEDVARLKGLGCQYAQGYYYGTPMTAGEALNYLAQTPG